MADNNNEVENTTEENAKVDGNEGKAKKNKGVSYTQTRSMKTGKDAKDFPIILTIDGDVAKSLKQGGENPVVLALVFSAFAVQVASPIRNPKKGVKALTIPEMQKVASIARPKIGKSHDPIKRKDAAITNLQKSIQHMTKKEIEKIRKMLG